MIEVYKSITAGHPRLVEFYDNFEDFFRINSEAIIKSQYGYTQDQIFYNDSPFWGENPRMYPAGYVKVAYVDGKPVTPDYLIGLERKIGFYSTQVRKKRWKKRIFQRRQGQTTPCYGGSRRPQYHNELRNNVIVDELEPPIRGSRKALMELNDWWNEFPSHAEKNWKHYRKTQWKTRDI